MEQPSEGPMFPAEPAEPADIADFLAARAGDGRVFATRTESGNAVP